jgi:mannose-6-phosphate isomerase-like protein (cupin superfamily)
MTTLEKQLRTIRDGQDTLYLSMTDQFRIKASSADTDEAYTMLEVIVPPAGGPPGLHTHPQQETFYILEGEFAIDTLHNGLPVSEVVHPGDVVNVPGMAPHNYRNIGSLPGRFVSVQVPGGFDRFLLELGVPINDSASPTQLPEPPDMQQIMEICARHNVSFVR